MSGAHTPGPWTVDNDATYPMGSYISNVAGDADICRMADWLLSDLTECEANARLIAAAPELLDQLERMAGFYSTAIGKDRNWEAARAAIAKARGGA